jgi:type II secretory pathway pseudopilin PulG
MANSAQQDQLSRRSLRLLALGVVAFIMLGIATPFVVVQFKNSVLKNNETATLQLLRDYVKAQSEYFAKHKEYAQNFADLGAEFSAAPEIGARGKDLHGYQYRIMRGESALDGSKSFLDADGKMTRKHGLMAAPLKYGVTGKDTFFVSGDQIFVLDIGPKTEQAVAELNHLTIPDTATKLP